MFNQLRVECSYLFSSISGEREEETCSSSNLLTQNMHAFSHIVNNLTAHGFVRLFTADWTWGAGSLYFVSPVCSSHQPQQPLPVLRVELHEPQVVLPACSGCSPLPQRVCRHQHPQWLLKGGKNNQWWPCRVWTIAVFTVHDGGHFKGKPRIRWSILCCGQATWAYPPWPMTFFNYVCSFFCWLSKSIPTFNDSRQVLHFHFLIILPSHASTQFP